MCLEVHIDFEFSKYSASQRAMIENTIPYRHNIKVEPNIADVYYAGQVFTGSRHTTNPLAISNKIFDKFIELGGMYINQNVKNSTQLKKLCNNSWLPFTSPKNTAIFLAENRLKLKY